jgi:hypothetical protein
MKHISSNLESTKNRIMRRVWYTYFISLLGRPVTAVGMVFGASLMLFFKLVSVSAILHNLLEVRLGAVPQYVWQTFVKLVENGEFLKLVSLALIIVSVLYLRSLLKHATFESGLMRSV